MLKILTLGEGLGKMITINTLFSGIGAQEAALKRLGLDFEVVGISEIDKFAIQSYEAINGPTRNYGDITQIPYLDYADLWTYSSPCFTHDSLVLTEKNGYKQITNLQIGESVLTHDGTYKTVENVINNGMKKTVKVYGMGVDEIHTTPNHLFYVREKSHIWNCKTRSYTRVFSKPIWKQADSLKRTDYMGVPVNNKSEIPEWNGITFVWSDGRKDRYKNQLSQYMNNKDFWWLIGRYIADGWFRNNGGIIIGCGKNKFIEMKEKSDSIGLNYSVSEERTVIRFRYTLKELELFVQPFGKYAYGKRIPSFVMDLPLDLLESFLDGYMAGDGCFTNRRFKATSVSRELVYGLAQCIAKVYKQPYSIYKTKRPKTTVIEGRTVNQKDTYELCFKKTKCIQDKAFYENGFLWFPVNKVEEADIENVYDLTVEENHSFTVQGVIVHNCQDFSTAGKQQGIYNAEGSLTRSGLLKHVERLLETSVMLGNQPKYLLMENVKGLVSKKFKPDFLNWLNKLESLGYNNYWQVLNAKDYGVPQNRERVFVVSIRKDIDIKGYTFPAPVPLEKRLKDMLEPCVDEKYCLSEDKVAKFLQNGNTNPSGKGINGNVCTGDICNTLTTNKGEGLKIKEVSNTVRCGGGGSLDDKHTWDIVVEPSKELIFMGGIGGPNRLKDGKYLSRNYKDGYRVYNEQGISSTINANGGGLGGTTGLYLTTEPLCAASRGRNPENPSDRTAGTATEQRLEINNTGCSNTLTTVQKDNYVVEPVNLDKDGNARAICNNYSKQGVDNILGLKGYGCTGIIQLGNIVNTGNFDNPQRGRIDSPSGISPTLNTVGGGGLEPKIVEQYRIRKLTPKECWRLMGFTDIEFECAQISGVSNSQLYRQAGNSIVVDVLVAIFKELLK